MPGQGLGLTRTTQCCSRSGMAGPKTVRPPDRERAGYLEDLVATVESEDGILPANAVDRARRLAAFVAHAESIAWPDDAESEKGDRVLIDLTDASISTTHSTDVHAGQAP